MMPDRYKGLICSSWTSKNEHNELQQQLPNQRVHSSYLPTVPSRSKSSSAKLSSTSSSLCSNFTKIDHLRIPDKLFVHKNNKADNNGHHQASSILQEAAATMMMHSSALPQDQRTAMLRRSSKRLLLSSNDGVDGGGGCGSSKRSLFSSSDGIDEDFDESRDHYIHRKSNTWPRLLVPSLSSATRFAVPEALFPPRQLNEAHANATSTAHYYTSSPYTNHRDCGDEATRIASTVAQLNTACMAPSFFCPSFSSSRQYHNSRRNNYSETTQPSSLDPSYSSQSSSSLYRPSRRVSYSSIATTTTKDFFLLDEIREEIRSMTEGTRLVPLTNKKNPSINIDDHSAIRTHKILGIGAFSTVTRVTIDQRHHQQQNESTNESDRVVDRRRGLRRPRYYACKSVKKSIAEMGENSVRSNNVDNEDSNMYLREYVNAFAQIANEVHVLSSFDHPNIIKIRGSNCCNGIASSSSSSLSSSLSSSFGTFLLTDVLQETLDQRIERWKRNALGDSSNVSVCSQSISSNSTHSEISTVSASASASSSSSSTSTSRSSKSQRRNSRIIVNHHHHHHHQMNIDKFDICLQLISALEYVHSRNVIYRDLKSSNIGFAADGTLQLFDFGLCVELTPSRQVAEGVIGK
jgi:hypothetical protein